MKKVWVVLLSVGLILSFAMSSSAADVKFSGSYYAQGWYADRPTLKKDVGPSTALYHNRLRTAVVFKVAEGLTLKTRFDALERVWGDNVSASTGQGGMWGSGEQNLQIDHAYAEFDTAIGMFVVGNMGVNAFGTLMLDHTSNTGAINWFGKFGAFSPFAKIEKWGESSYGPKTAGTTGAEAADRDYDRYRLGLLYNKAPLDAGVEYTYTRNAYFRPVAAKGEAVDTLHAVNPYVRAKIGPVSLQAEGKYSFGERGFNQAGLEKMDLEGIAAGVCADYFAGPLQLGLSFYYLQGDDPDTKKIEGYDIQYGWDSSLTLILWELWYHKFVSTRQGYVPSANALQMSATNAWIYQGRVGFKVTPKLSLLGWVTYANADKKPKGFVSDSYGTEIDITATYKIYDNLSYMVGAGYLMTGDYFKGTSNHNQIADNWALTHKITLTF